MRQTVILFLMIVLLFFAGCRRNSSVIPKTIQVKQTDTILSLESVRASSLHIDTISNVYGVQQSALDWIFMGERVYPAANIDFQVRDGVMACLRSHDTLLIVSNKRSMFSCSFDNEGQLDSIKSLHNRTPHSNEIAALNWAYDYSCSHHKRYIVAYNFSAPPLTLTIYSNKDTIEYFVGRQGGVNAFVICDTLLSVGGLHVNNPISMLLEPIGLTNFSSEIHVIILTALNGYRYNGYQLNDNFGMSNIYMEIVAGRIVKIASAVMQPNYPGLCLLLGSETALYGNFFYG